MGKECEVGKINPPRDQCTQNTWWYCGSCSQTMMILGGQVRWFLNEDFCPISDANCIGYVDIEAVLVQKLFVATEYKLL